MHATMGTFKDGMKAILDEITGHMGEMLGKAPSRRGDDGEDGQALGEGKAWYW